MGHPEEEYGLAHSIRLERRAAAVASYLEGKGIASGRLAASGAGESEPIADNSTAEGRAQNRRVVLRRTDCEQAQ
jgi:outer membrane protein OmpA-like peptidoglycan-associated protein